MQRVMNKVGGKILEDPANKGDSGWVYIYCITMSAYRPACFFPWAATAMAEAAVYGEEVPHLPPMIFLGRKMMMGGVG